MKKMTIKYEPESNEIPAVGTPSGMLFGGRIFLLTRPQRIARSSNIGID
jgi:hypothetical protein